MAMESGPRIRQLGFSAPELAAITVPNWLSGALHRPAVSHIPGSVPPSDPVSATAQRFIFVNSTQGPKIGVGRPLQPRSGFAPNRTWTMNFHRMHGRVFRGAANCRRDDLKRIEFGFAESPDCYEVASSNLPARLTHSMRRLVGAPSSPVQGTVRRFMRNPTGLAAVNLRHG